MPGFGSTVSQIFYMFCLNVFLLLNTYGTSVSYFVLGLSPKLFLKRVFLGFCGRFLEKILCLS
jgi:hypothetical protein